MSAIGIPSVWAGVLTVSVAALNLSLVTAQPVGPRRGPIQSLGPEEGRPLQTRLQRSDALVHVDSGRVAPPFQTRQLSATDYLRELAERSGLVGVITIDSIAGRLASEGEWVESDVTASIVQSLKWDGTLAKVEPDRIHFVDDGGIWSHNGTLVVAETKWIRPLRLNSSYVLFAFSSHRRLSVHPLAVFELQGSLLVSRNREDQNTIMSLNQLKDVLQRPND